MEFSGRYVVPAPPAIVWAALNDAEILKSCIPGCERVTKTDPTHFEMAIALKIGPIKATFLGNVTLENLQPPRRCTLKAEGQGGVAGFAKGEAEIELTPENTGTALAYTAKANVGGKLAQIGQKFVDGAAKQIADDFFARFSSAIAAASLAGVSEPAGRDIDEEAPLPEPPPFVESEPPPVVEAANREGLAPEIWVVGLIAVIIILLVLFGVSL